MKLRLAGAVFSISSLAALIACDSKSFNASFCTSYAQSYEKSCIEACTKGGRPADACTSGCKAALAKDPTYGSRCTQNATATASAPH